MPARRLVTAAAATVLAAGPAVLAGAGGAHATEEQGRAGAAVLRTGLDVSLLDKTVGVPLALSLNEVRAPGSARETALTATLDGVDGGKPFSVLRADVADAGATVADGRAEGRSELAHATVHLPGLPLLSLIEVEQVTSRAVCEAGKEPLAESNLLGSVTVLGKKVTLTAGGTTEVKVPGVGEVRVDLSTRETTSRTAAATALGLTVSVNPLELNVAEIEGTVTLAEATCESPAEPPAKDDGSAVAEPQGSASETALAETGGDSATPYVASAAAALLLAGATALAATRRRKRG